MTKLCHCTFLSACLPLTLGILYGIFVEKTTNQLIMIQKLRNEDYLKRVGRMTPSELSEYRSMVAEWLEHKAPLLENKKATEEAGFQNILQCCTSWNDSECSAFFDGSRLLTALISFCETWLPDMLYTKSAKRVIGKMTSALEELQATAPAAAHDATSTKDKADRQESRVVKESSPAERHDGIPDKTPARPNHIDQYVHLLPKKTQERAAKYGQLMREFDEMREKERILMESDNVSAKDREAVAKRIVAIDKEVGSINKELDAEWEKVAKSGRVVVDDLGMARVKDIEHSTLNIEHSSSDIEHQPSALSHQTSALSPQPSDISPQPSALSPQTSLTSEQKARRRELRKFLTDTRRGNGKTREEHVVKWQEAWKEYLTLEPEDAALKDEKIVMAAVHYGIVLTQ